VVPPYLAAARFLGWGESTMKNLKNPAVNAHAPARSYFRLRSAPLFFALAAASGMEDAHASCGSAFCMVNTNWNLQGVAVEPGLRLDLRYEYINQDQPMSGSDKVGVGQIPRHHDEVKTINRNYVATLDYTIDDRWGVLATLPVLDRFHVHIHNHGGAKLPEQWDFTELGDVRVLGRYQWRSEDSAAHKLNFYGVNFGLKLPTGEIHVRNAAGDLAERTLQPGTGTTDLLLGAFYSQLLGHYDSSWFIQGLWQAPLNSREDYKPGQRVSFDVGFRYEATGKLGLMIQLNALYKGRDSGAQAEPDDTGGKFVFISPGISYAVAKNFQVYGFVQKPLYQYVNGVQLTADWSALVGVSARF
jgi:hypothetical protein